MILSIIAGIGKNFELGKDNWLLWDLKSDMKYFRETTRGHAVIMGRKTFESIGKPLPNRRNIIITRDKSYSASGTEIVNSLEEAINLFKNTLEEVFVIGGGEIYRQAIAYADKLYITHVDGVFPNADTHFPPIDTNIWQKEKSDPREPDSENNYAHDFTIYKRK